MERIRPSCSFAAIGFSGSRNQTNEIDQLNQIDKIDQTDQTDETDLSPIPVRATSYSPSALSLLARTQSFRTPSAIRYTP